MNIKYKNRFFGKPCLFFIALLLFSGLTVVYMNYYKPYEVVGGELLKNPGFENGFEGWGTSGLNSVESDLPGIVALYAMESGQNIFIYQRVREFSGVKFLRLSGKAETDSVAKGEEGWQRGRLIAVFHDENDKKIGTNVVSLPWGDSDWKYYEHVFELKPNTKSIRVGANIAQVAGIIRVQNISLKPVLIKAEAAYFKIFGLIIWMVMIVWLMWDDLKSLGLQHIKTLAFVGLLLVGMAMPGGVRDALLSQLPDISYKISHSFTFDIDTLSHFLLFLIVAFLLVKSLDEKQWWMIVIDLVLLGIFTEFLQVFIDGRVAESIDLLVNYSGLAVGAGLALLWKKRG
ncbi:MAG: VanZ family protein [Gammaproteobacteria bacterium]|nr:VanZ family protein [Gammaproteobacteria bacterium]